MPDGFTRRPYERRGHDPLTAGLYQRVVLQGAVNPVAWGQAEDGGEIIGACRDADCDGYLIADSPKNYGPSAITWFEARCLKCGHEVAAPGGRLLRRSSRTGERPARN